MTVAEMIEELQKLPPDIPVKIEGYVPASPSNVFEAAVFMPNRIECLRNEITGEFAVIWAEIETD